LDLRRPEFLYNRYCYEVFENRMSGRIDILGVAVDDFTFDEAISGILKLAERKNRGSYVVTVNSEFVMMARRNREFARILAGADLALADGKWVVFSKLILGGRAHDRITGVDLVEKLCARCAKKPIRIGFLGGFTHVAKTLAKRQKSLNPNLKVVFAEAGDPAIGYDLRLKSQLNRFGRVDILFVAYGMGKQEKWVQRMKSLDVGVFIGVGGAFDYLADVKRRAPKLWQVWGMEWLWRLILEPARIWRMRVLPAFFVLVLGQFIKKQFLSSSN